MTPTPISLYPSELSSIVLALHVAALRAEREGYLNIAKSDILLAINVASQAGLTRLIPVLESHLPRIEANLRAQEEQEVDA